jgi:hypothetical protein
MKTNEFDDLEKCKKTVEELEQQKEQLEEENQHLRQAAGDFGQLAERLNKTLRRERRQDEPDREPRNVPDRRNG